MKPWRPPLSPRERALRIGLLMVTAAIIGMAIWVLFFYGNPGDAGQVPR